MMKKSSFSQHIPLLALALGSLALIVCCTHFVLEKTEQNNKTFALADMQSVMDAQKLKWLTRMKEGETALVLEESKTFPAKLDQVLKTLAIRENVIILDKLTLDSGKTRDAVKVLNAIGVTKSAIVVTRDVVESVKRATNNIPKVELSPAELLSVYDVVKADKCIFTEEAIMAVQDKYFMTVEGEVEDNE